MTHQELKRVPRIRVVYSEPGTGNTMTGDNQAENKIFLRNFGLEPEPGLYVHEGHQIVHYGWRPDEYFE